MKLVVGTGNPGRRYAGTRHNAGFLVLRRFARQEGIALRERPDGSRAGRGAVGSCPLTLLEPATYVNLMGEAVARAVRETGVELQALLVLVDDVNLPLGRLRLRPGGSSGGHNGLKSVEAALGSRDYPRLRFGIGRAPGLELAQYVLDRFAAAEEEILDEALGRAAAAVRCWASEGLGRAMDRFNALPAPGEAGGDPAGPGAGPERREGS